MLYRDRLLKCRTVALRLSLDYLKYLDTQSHTYAKLAKSCVMIIFK